MLPQLNVAWLTASVIAITVAITRPVASQPVSVSLVDGVHVRAPFVSVDVFSNGGVSVRAPYTAVDVGPRLHVVDRVVYRDDANIPSSYALAAKDNDALWLTLRNASWRLHQRLIRFDTGTTWQRYLRLPDELATGSLAGAEERRAAAAVLQQRFAAVAANPEYQRISNLPEFIAVQSVLREISVRQVGAKPDVSSNAEELPPPQQIPRETDPSERSVVVPPQP